MINRLHTFLTYSGTIPFVVSSILLLLNINSIPYLGYTLAALCLYGLVILSFMAGSLWGLHLGPNRDMGPTLPLLSNATAIVLWVSFLTVSPLTMILLQILVFLALLLLDLKLLGGGVISSSYYKLRFRATLVVVICLAITAFLIYGKDI